MMIGAVLATLAGTGLGLGLGGATPTFDPRPPKPTIAKPSPPVQLAVQVASGRQSHKPSTVATPSPVARLPSGSRLVLSRYSGQPVSRTVEISGNGFARGTLIEVIWNDVATGTTVGSTVTRSGRYGRFKTSLGLPPLAGGDYEVVAGPINGLAKQFVDAFFRVVFAGSVKVRYDVVPSGLVIHLQGRDFLSAIPLRVTIGSLGRTPTVASTVLPDSMGSFAETYRTHRLPPGQYFVVVSERGFADAERVVTYLAILS